MKNYGAVDYWGKCPAPDPRKAIVFMESEHGAAAFIGLSGYMPDEPIGYLASRFMRQDSINTIPEHEEPCWYVYQLGDTLLLNIRGFHTPETLGMSPMSLWTYYYPVLKGVVLFLEDYGVKELEFLNSTYSHDHLPDDLFPQLSNEELHHYSFTDPDNQCEQSVFLHAPAWAINWMFKHTRNAKSSLLTTVGFDLGDNSVDIIGAATIGSYIAKKYDFKDDLEKRGEIIQMILENDAVEKEAIQNVLNVTGMQTNGDGVMFG